MKTRFLQALHRTRLLFWLFGSAFLSTSAGSAAQVQPKEMEQADRFARDRIAQLVAGDIESQATIRHSKQGWGSLHTGWSVNHRILRLKGDQYLSGFGSHADAEITIDIPAGANHLSGLCGVDDTTEARQNPHPVIFRVFVNGKESWHGVPQTASDDAARFDADLAGAATVTLKATGAGDLTYTPADFVDVQLTRVDGTVQLLGQRRELSMAGGSGISFTYGGTPSSDFLSRWKLEQGDLPETATYTTRQFSRTDPATQMICKVTLKQYKHFPVVEWTTDFENDGKQDSPVLENIRSMDLSFPAEDKLLLHHHTGDHAAADSWEPHETELLAGKQLHFAPKGGRPTDTAWPYFNLENPEEHAGAIVVAGWPGQWSADFVRSADDPATLHILAGQELTHFILHPGEKARTPISVVMLYQADAVRAQNLWRRWMLEENVPRINGKLPMPVNASSLGLHQSEKSEIDGISLFTSNGANLTHWWMDAGWYPCNQWWDGVGSWTPDPARFPHGIRAVSDAAHGHGLKLILWLEPERVHPGTDLDRNHPQWLLGKDGSDKLFNLGDPAAWNFMVSQVDHLIKTQGIDVYRQDFNEEALGFWRANDAPDRQGITEMRHIEGYLHFWDELHARHPDLLIDTCASGGRRLDLEALRRSVPLWRSDDSNNPEHNQCQTFGLSSWLPLYGSGSGCDSTYSIRSEMLPFFTLGLPSDGSAIDWNLYRREKANWARISNDLMGDYYPLLPYSRDAQSWMAWQFDRPDLATGAVQVFRRHASPYQSAKFPLRGLDPQANYLVTDLDHPDEPRRLSGQQLTTDGLEIHFEVAPAAAIFTYARQP